MTDTKITYDISDAISKLNQLNKKLGEIGDTTIEAFGGEASSALDNFIDLIGDFSQTAARGVSALRTMAGALGPVGLVAGVAAAGLASVAANLIDMPELLADNASKFDTLAEAMQRMVDLRRGLGDIGDAAKIQEFDKRILEFQNQGVEARLRRRQLGEEKAILREQLNAAKSRIDAEERLWKDSIQRVADIKKRLSESQAAATVSGVERGAMTSQRAVGDLSARAQQEAMKGNLDLAEKLRDRAQELASELGGHVFFQNQVDAASKSITDNMQKQIAKEQNVQKGAFDRAKAEAETAKQLQEQIKSLEKQIRLQGDITTAARAGARGAGAEKAAFQRQDKRDEAALDFATQADKFVAGFRSVGASVAEQLQTKLKTGAATVFGGGAREQAAGLAVTEQAFRDLGKLANLLNRENLTPQQVQQEGGPLFESVLKLTETLRTAQNAGIVKGTDKDIQRLDAFIKAADRAIKDAERFVAEGGSATGAIKPGAESVFAAQERKTVELGNAADKMASGVKVNIDALNRNTNALLGKSGPGTTAPAAQLQQQQKLPAGVVPIPAAQTINVNANVKGGIIDAETTRTITDIIRKELRKETLTKTK